MAIGILGIHHVAVIASDYERSKDFYTRILGGTPVSEVYRESRRSWKLDLVFSDGVQIELFSFEGAPERLSYPEARGLRHLAFCVQNVVQSKAYLNSQGIETEKVRVDEITGKRFVFFQDPDSLPLELYEV